MKGSEMKLCQACGRELALGRTVGRQEACPSCGADLHCCLNCMFHAEGVYNECREPQAERVVEKNRSNFCDYFSFREGASGVPKRQAARDKLDGLFTKK